MSVLISSGALQARVLVTATRSTRSVLLGMQRRTFASPARSPGRRGGGGGGGGRLIRLLAVAVVSGAGVIAYQNLASEAEREKATPQLAEIEFEKPRKQPVSKEDNRDLVSSQHLQVKKSWESPGVYAWGANEGRVVAPDLKDAVVKTPRRMAFFDGHVLRDLKLDREFGVAVTETGDLLQWGAAFSRTATAPVVTLRGKDIVKVSLSRDRILALSSSGSVYSLPVSAADQAFGQKQSTSSWMSFWSSPSTVSYRTVGPSLGWGEKVTDVSSGRDHCLMLTSKGRVFSAASSTESFPSQGQLGIPGLNWATRPRGPYDQPHEVTALRGFSVKQVAAGDFHSLVLDREGRIWLFGDNSTGQLGFAPTSDMPYVDEPWLLPLRNLYSGSNLSPRATSIAAGGSNTYFTVDATKTGPSRTSPADATAVGPARTLGDVVADTWACGEGLYGSLGTGKWTHVSNAPTKIKALSGLFEFDELRNRTVPIRLARVSVGATHAAAVMDNVTRTAADGSTSAHDTNWGADVVWWGGNEHYQLGTGKRSNLCAPTYIGPLDGGEADAEKGRRGEVHRLHLTPRTTIQLGQGAWGMGRRASVEQRVECGRFVSAVYSGT